MKLKLVFITFMTLVLLLASNVPVYADCLDPGIPDSAIFLDPIIYCDDGHGIVKVDLPVYLAQYENVKLYVCEFYLQPEVEFVGVSLGSYWDDTACVVDVIVFNDTLARFAVLAKTGLMGDPGVPPNSGRFATVHLEMPNDFLFFSREAGMRFCIMCVVDCDPVDYINFEVTANVSVSEPDPGDVDCSGVVEISDAVHLIDYIFQGGIPPYNLNAADCDASCVVEVSDAVYLIEYIFNNGDAPQEGCVF